MGSGLRFECLQTSGERKAEEYRLSTCTLSFDADADVTTPICNSFLASLTVHP